jgi:uncharacterized protein YkwD
MNSMSNPIARFLRHYFIPHESNNFKARSLHIPALFFYIALLFTVQTSINILKSSTSDVLGFATNVSTDRILALVNDRRAQSGLVPLTLSPALNSAAANKAAHMFANNYWAHLSPAGNTPWEFIRGSGYNYQFAGENLAKSFDTSDAIMDAWMKSPTHRANIMKPEYREMGLAIVNGKLLSEDTTLVVQMFGTRVGVDANSNQKPVALAPQPGSLAQKESVRGESEISTPPSSNNTLTFFGSVSPFTTRSLSFIVAEILLVFLLLDGIWIWKTRTYRVSSKSVAHIIFIAALLGAMGATSIGAIL